MVTQISLAVIAIALVILVGFLIAALVKFRKAIFLIQNDIHQLSIETARLIARFNGSDESSSQNSTLPQLVDWLSTGYILVKKSKEFIKKYVK
jgi:uncharacterized protein YoxC